MSVPVQVSAVPIQVGYWCFSAWVYRYRLEVYWYRLEVYRYRLATGAFLYGCTGTSQSCTGTGCLCTFFSAMLHFPKLHQAVAIILTDPYSLSGHETLYNYALNLKNLYKSKNTKTIKSTYSYAKCEQSVT